MGVDGFNQVKGAVFGWVVDWGLIGQFVLELEEETKIYPA